ncbi:MAG: glycosyltransferase family 39 protein [Xanthobacteraceae bacterium]|nr:glycosyltransferase family 39 protein [Xanthobacteraceae bacterium]
MLRAFFHLPLAAILALAAVLRLWNLSENGYGREYYAAAVRGMLQNWHNVFFNSFDPGGFVTLDKPPVAIWIQALFAKLFGFSGLNSLLPQVLLGLAAVLLVFLLVRRTFGERTALLAALVLAVTPASVAIDRSNNTESCLIVVLLLAAWFAMRAAESGRLRDLCGAMLMLGIGFNVKMAAALILAPAIALSFFFFNRQIPFTRHLKFQTVACGLMIALALSWVTAFDLVPAGKRPYAGSTKHNSMLELALLHNGAARFTQPAAAAAPQPDKPHPVLYDESAVGPLRLFRALQAGQAAWLLPLALAGIIFGFFSRGKNRTRDIAIAIWGGWLASYWIVFSAAGGPFHTYYLATLAPALSALAAIGASEIWHRYRDGEAPRWLASVTIVLAISWQAWIFIGQTQFAAPSWLNWVAALSALLAMLGAAAFAGEAARKYPALAALPAGLLVLPVIAALSVVLIRPNVPAPVTTVGAFSEAQTPDAFRLNPRRAEPAREKLISFLKEQHGSEKFLVAVENALLAGPLIIATGAPVMALGGYLGTDPILTPEKLAVLAESGAIRFVMIGGFSLTQRNTPNEITLREWILKNATPVDPQRWSLNPGRAGKPFRLRLGGVMTEMTFPELYDLRVKPVQ